jgi:hypothetical protein
MELRLASAALLCAMVAGCATDDVGEGRRRPTDADYVTGSRIPQKDKSGVSTITVEAWERAAEQASQPLKPRQ